MSSRRFATWILAVGAAVSGFAQGSTNAAPDAALNRHIEVMVRAQYNVPQNYSVTLGAREASQIPGYQKLPVTISNGVRGTVVPFLISEDNKTLARLETFDLTKDPAFSIDVAGRPVRGNPAAKVTVINFDDLECPYCARMHEALFPATLERYKDKVRFVYKDDPLVELHPWAMHAAVNANCLADASSEAYWGYVDYLHAHGQEITGEDRSATKSNAALDRIADQVAALHHVEPAKLKACIQAQDESKVKDSAHQAEALGVDGTPALFINGERINGWVPEQQLWLVIDRALRAAGEEPPAAPTPAPAPAKAKPADPSGA